ncbi:MAG: hypothetical protein U9R43_06685 [Thermodesulfobacteriota bacterium]|nr:hypothetical protein [Thermodesulfobacteriota bacterium]
MKPLYFPFTYISKPVAEALHACFGKTIIYQPSSKNIPEEIHKLAERGVLDIRISGNPEKHDEEKLSAILKEYDAWANMHQESRGIHLDFFKAGRNKIPFFDDTSTYQIKADIEDITGENPARKKSDPVFNAGLFLSIAQNFDIQNDKIIRDMASFETARMDLIKSLKGEDETSPVVPGYGDEFKTGNLADYDHMIPERIAAWALLMCCDPMQCRDEMPGLFVTSSRQAIDYLLDKTPETENVFSIDAIPMVENQVEKTVKWPHGLMEHLEMVAESSRPLKKYNFNADPGYLNCETMVSLSLYVVPGASPLEYFSRFISFDPTCGEIEKNRVKFKNTLIGHIAFSA